MLVLISLATIPLLLATPFSAEEGEFLHALRSGEVTSVAVGRSADFAKVSPLKVTQLNGEDDVVVGWVNRFGFRREAVLADLGSRSPVTVTDTAPGTSAPGTSAPDTSAPDTSAPDTSAPGTSAPALDPSASIVKTARSLGVAAPTIVEPGDLPFDHLKWLSLLVTILMVGLLLNGPQPRRMTKWGTFWAYTYPLNVGIFYAVLRDAPWNARMTLLPEPGPGVTGVVADPVTGEVTRRRGGWMMFIVFALLTNLVISLALLALSWTFPTYLDPVGWSAVDLAGKAMAP